MMTRGAVAAATIAAAGALAAVVAFSSPASASKSQNGAPPKKKPRAVKPPHKPPAAPKAADVDRLRKSDPKRADEIERERAERLKKKAADSEPSEVVAKDKIPQHPVDVKPDPAAKPAATRKPSEAATALYSYATQLIRAGRAGQLGTKEEPNATVKRAQEEMRGLVAEGVYGPKTMARGKELLGKPFPSRAEKHARAPEAPAPKPAAPKALPADTSTQPASAEAFSDAELSEWQRECEKRGGRIVVTSGAAGVTGHYCELPNGKKYPADDDSLRRLKAEPVPAAKPAKSATPAAKSASAPAPAAGRSPEQAATELLAYLKDDRTKAQPRVRLGYKDHGAPFVLDAQEDMGIAEADGIYGPGTRALGSKLTGKPFPQRVTP